MYKTLTGIIARRIPVHLEEHNLLPAEQKRMQGSTVDIKSNIGGLQEEKKEFKHGMD
jgi:hypothetical protein